MNKDLNNLTSKELGQLFPIIIQNYDDKWVEMYRVEKQLITASLLKSDIIRIDHMGSTAIQGLKSKPTIDILLQLSKNTDLQLLKNVFKSLAYQPSDQPDNPPPHLSFYKGYTEYGFKGQSYHVHIRYKGDWDEIRFRDYLISHPEIAKEYENLKLKFAKKFKNYREAYTESKTEFIEKINKLTKI